MLIAVGGAELPVVFPFIVEVLRVRLANRLLGRREQDGEGLTY